MKLKPIHPNAGIEVWLRKRLLREIEAMDQSVRWWLGAAYRSQEGRIDATANPPAKSYVVVAADARPADYLERVMAALRRRWGKRWDALGEEIAEKFARRAGATVDDAVEAALRGADMRVSLQISKAQRDQLAATVNENVALIRTIPEQYLGAVEGHVMRSVLAGRDLQGLNRDIKATYGVTTRRARLIARDQNNKATAYFTKTRQLELGIEQAVWVHSGAGKTPRPSHVKAGRERVVYNVAEGWLDPAINKRIWPGTEINCRCTSRSIIAEPTQKEAA
jgi:uncharacterized protein with gpF-like domain